MKPDYQEERITSADAPKRTLSPLQSLQAVDASRAVLRTDLPDQTPPWVAAGMTWRQWARRQHA